MNAEPSNGRFSSPTPESLAGFEELVRARLGGRLREFRLSIGDAGLVLEGWASSHHTKQLAQQFLTEITPAPLLANIIEVRA
jgi:hypothetical protein